MSRAHKSTFDTKIFFIMTGILLWTWACVAHGAPHMILSTPFNYVTAPIPAQVIPMDMDSDGDTDLAIKCIDVQNGPLLQLFENRGDGGFTIHSSLQMPSDSIISIGDIDGDGRIDMVQTSKVGLDRGRVTILMQNGPFSFSVYTQDISFLPDRVCLGNMDNSNGLDLVISDALIPEVGIFLNNGTGTFLLQGTYDRELLIRDVDGDGVKDHQTNFHTLDMICSDLDNDGDDDLVITNAMSRTGGKAHNVVRLLNDGTGTMGPFMILMDPFGGALGVDDVDADGDRDILTLGVSPSGPALYDIYLLKNYGNGSFQQAQRFPSGCGNHLTGSVRLADVDGDGDMDLGILVHGLVYGNPNDKPTDRWALYRNNGAGALTGPEFLPTGAGVLDLAFADLDAVNGPEAITVAGDDSRLTISYNVGGLYTVPSSISIDDQRAWIHGTTPIDIAAGDYDNDGLQDIAVIADHSRLTDAIPDTLTILSGIPNGISNNPAIMDLPQEVPMRIVSAPAAGTAAWDIGVIFLGDDIYGYPTGTGFSLGTVGGLPAPMHFTSLNGPPSDLAMLDVNGDGTEDMAVLRDRKEGLAVGISILSVADDGTMTYLGDLLLGSDDVLDYDSRLPYVIAAGDMDNDGLKDIVAVTWNLLGTKNGIVSVIKNYGNLNFGLIGEFLTVEREVTDIIVADVTGDGVNDVILTTVPSMSSPEGDGSLEVLPNTGAGLLGTAQSYNVGTGPVRVAAAQMDSAPGLDLIVANRGSNEITVLFNNGTGIFNNQERYLSGGGTDAMTVADIDQDGDNDVVVANDEYINFPGMRDHYATVTI